jgi:lipopolysaccharide export system protein LptA
VTEGDSNHQLTKAIIQGNHSAQAHFWTTTDITKPPMHAHANTINYYPDRHLIELIGNARVEQGKDSLFAPKISYDTLHQHVISQGNDKGRTMIIIHPDHYHE